MSGLVAGVFVWANAVSPPLKAVHKIAGAILNTLWAARRVSAREGANNPASLHIAMPLSPGHSIKNKVS